MMGPHISRSVLEEHAARLEGFPPASWVRVTGRELRAIVLDALEHRRLYREESAARLLLEAQVAERVRRLERELGAGHQGAALYAARELGVAERLGFSAHVPPEYAVYRWDVVLEDGLAVRAPDVVTAFQWLRAAWAVGELGAKLTWRALL